MQKCNKIDKIEKCENYSKCLVTARVLFLLLPSFLSHLRQGVATGGPGDATNQMRLASNYLKLFEIPTIQIKF